MAQHQLPPAVMKIVLGNELARQRVEAGLTQDDAASVLRCTQQKIAHIERGSGIRAIELDALLERYGASEDDSAYARDLQAEGNRRAKRGAFSSRFRQHMRLFVDMEPSCQRIFAYRALVLPGLLQTERYMHVLSRAWRPSLGRDQIERDIADRLARQEALDNTDQQFWFVIDEAALHRITGTPEVVKEQVMALVAALDRPNVDIQVVPFAAGYYMGQGHDYSIFGYDTKPAVSIVYLEQHDGGTYVDDAKRTSGYLTLWDQQKAAASGPEQTRRFLLELVDGL
ncbi:helix-turn-helix domain-containing protein [Saccharopolyspora flava]|uniref:Helix-turn-helix domain-containing protein n=1 Tax=Saccharopolyspora flava TaxID=95161 RepID=A0A1I6TPB1_9PSEU|nr:helix-turn-helix transcriptional regulator [Saccharopolyspora flava]SFS90807.1 Helix-turn-helix domain-containing protein [Saccharopolyspora flava]